MFAGVIGVVMGVSASRKKRLPPPQTFEGQAKPGEMLESVPVMSCQQPVDQQSSGAIGLRAVVPSKPEANRRFAALAWTAKANPVARSMKAAGRIVRAAIQPATAWATGGRCPRTGRHEMAGGVGAVGCQTRFMACPSAHGGQRFPCSPYILD